MKLQKSFDQSFGAETDYTIPDRYRDLFSTKSQTQLIAQGSGLSYSAVSFDENSTTVSMKKFDRILSYDESTGMIEVESGVTLGKIYEFLDQKNRYLKVQPGHPQITIGGCIACNIFGKNQTTEGLFSDIVVNITIFHPAKGLIQLSRSENPTIFDLTCGGFGMTGIIVSSCLNTSIKPGHSIHVLNITTNSLLETYRKMCELKCQYDLLYTWNDLTNSSLGKGFIIAGKFAPEKCSENRTFQKISSVRRNLMNILSCRLAVKFLNILYHILNTKIKFKKVISLFEFNFPVANKTIYFKLFGNSGFIEKQILIRHPEAVNFISELESLIENERPVISLCSCKLFSGKHHLLNFSGEGFVISLDFANSPSHQTFRNALDRLCIKYLALVNICKDSTIHKNLVRGTYPEYDLFRERLLAWDPDRQFTSSISKRIGL